MSNLMFVLVWLAARYHNKHRTPFPIPMQSR